MNCKPRIECVHNGEELREFCLVRLKFIQYTIIMLCPLSLFKCPDFNYVKCELLDKRNKSDHICNIFRVS